MACRWTRQGCVISLVRPSPRSAATSQTAHSSGYGFYAPNSLSHLLLPHPIALLVSPLLSPLLPAPPLSSILLIPLSPAARCLRAALSRARPTYTVRVKQGHLVLWEQIASQSEVNRAIFLELVRPLEVRRGIVQCLLGDGGHLQPARMLAQPKR